MCGIYLACDRAPLPNPGSALRTCLKNRGPDHCRLIGRNTQELLSSGGIQKTTKQPSIYLKSFSTVLSLRGSVVVEQPLIDPASASLLCWNGEAWKIDGHAIVGNDATAVLELLVNCTNLHDSNSSVRETCDGSNEGRVVDAFSRITGPYAFVYYDAYNCRIYYGRDILGRRSLLVKHQKDSFAISSVCDPEAPEQWEEVEPNSIHVLELFAKSNASQLVTDGRHLAETLNLSECTFLESSRTITQFPHFNRAEPSTQPLGLAQSSSIVSNLAVQIDAALHLRVSNIPLVPSEQATSPRLAILFSGGLDCTLLARLVHDIVPIDQEIDLLNVAFENPRIVQASARHNDGLLYPQSPYALCPDRMTGISSQIELMKTCPERKWRFVEINVPYSETLEHRPRITSLIQPHNTEMDLSIGCALYFAARGKGVTYNHATHATCAYTTPARVLLSGLGADEIFGGYQRHATAFHCRSYSGLIDELELDIKRLGKRNLGRDDRVISNWGKEVRYPYLDEGLVSWALGLPVWEKCGFGAQRNDGDGSTEVLEPAKRLLRLLACEKGLRNVAVEKKRAIQFGARTAKMEIGKVRGTQVLS